MDSCDEYCNYDFNGIVSPVNPDRLNDLLLITHFNNQDREFLVNGFRNGFDIGYRGPVFRQSRSNNFPITVGSHLELWNKIMKEVKLG